MTNRAFWRDLKERALQSPYLLLLFVSSVLLSIASFYTTYVGIVPFVAYPILSFFITSAIQSLLFVVSWRLGFMFAGKEPIAGTDLAVFAVCFTLSVFFSFSSLFNVIFASERQEETSLARVRDGATEATNRAEQKLKTQLADRLAELRDSAAYERWRADLRAVADLAQEQGGRLLDRVEAQRAAREREVAGLDDAARSLAARKGGLDDEIAAMELDLAELEKTRPALLQGLPELKAEVDAIELELVQKRAAMDAEAGGIGETGRVGQGPVWQTLEREHRRLLASGELKRQQLALREQRIAEQDARSRELAERLRKTRLLFAGIDTEIAAAQERALAAHIRLASFGAPRGLESGVQTLREYPARFEESADFAILEQAEALCTQLYDNLKTLVPPPDGLSGLSCDRGPVMPAVAAIGETRRALDDLQRHCTGTEAPSFHEMDLDGAVAAARACLDRSGLPYREIRAERLELDRLEREEGPNASEFTKTTNALLAGEKLAVFALLIALAMDVLVLFTGLIGAKSASASFMTRVLELDRNDDPEVVAIKSILSNVDPFHERIDGVRYEGRIELARIRDERARELAEQVLVRNTGSGLVRAAPGLGGLFYLRHGAIDRLEEQLEKRQGLAPAGATAAGRAGLAGRPYAAPGRASLVLGAGSAQTGGDGRGGGVRLYEPGERDRYRLSEMSGRPGGEPDPVERPSPGRRPEARATVQRWSRTGYSETGVPRGRAPGAPSPQVQESRTDSERGASGDGRTGAAREPSGTLPGRQGQGGGGPDLGPDPGAPSPPAGTGVGPADRDLDLVYRLLMEGEPRTSGNGSPKD